MKISVEVFNSHRKISIISKLFLAAIFSMVMIPCGELHARDQASSIEYLTGDDEASAKNKMTNGDYFTIDSTDEDVRRVQGEPDEKFFDGDRRVWYYGHDAIYFDVYGKVVDVQDYSGNLKFK